MEKQRELRGLVDSGIPFDQIVLWFLAGQISASEFRAAADKLDETKQPQGGRDD